MKLKLDTQANEYNNYPQTHPLNLTFRKSNSNIEIHSQ